LEQLTLRLDNATKIKKLTQRSKSFTRSKRVPMKPSIGVLVIILSFASHSTRAQSGWFLLNSGTTTNLNSIYFPDPETGFVVGDGGLILRTIDGGLTWATSPSGVSENLHDVYFFDQAQDTGVVVGDNGTILRTIDAGLTWATIASGVTENLYSVSFACNDRNGVAGGSSQTILRSDDRGRSWSVVQTGFFGGGFNGADMASNMIGMIAGENSIFQPLMAVTSDGASTWEFHAYYLNSNEGEANDVHCFNSNQGIVVSSVWDGTGAVSSTLNGGVDWTTMITPEDLRGIDFPTDSTGFIVGSSGVIMKSTDRGVSWVGQSSGTSETLREVSFPDSAYGNVGYAAGDNGMILKTINGGNPTSVDPGVDAAPAEFRLFDNYPNPFNPSTLIRFSITKDSRVTIDLFNALGQEIRTVTDQEYPAGAHVLSFDAAGLTSGTYFYRMRSGGFTDVKKMMLVR
jgi:photosystem II stability/assembly factor-like uncharacterized protein